MFLSEDAPEDINIPETQGSEATCCTSTTLLQNPETHSGSNIVPYTVQYD